MRRYLLLSVAGVILVVILLVWQASFLPTASAPSPTPMATESPIPVSIPLVTPVPTVSARSVAVPPPPLGGIVPVAMRVAVVSIDASVVPLGLNDDGTMASPNGPYEVGWYTFSAGLGVAGNAIFAGHVDWHTGVTGVFWRLRELAVGSEITLVGADGAEYVYAVISSTLYPAENVPLAEIIGPKPGQCITLISCEGTFNQATHDYDHRRVVVAKRAE